ncbi:hypothetical protein [Mycobacterium simiae]|uniref:Uncharacterized protein n=1 Tax=Mycobacterium simiae TaxID=1784 RepID=A0A1X0YG07_MYCSI|nr:hypothetical protein [Mycobacterium simiae]ORJ64040.1 hypothetical protein B5M45_02155 [Mycobacterium simiae]
MTCRSAGKVAIITGASTGVGPVEGSVFGHVDIVCNNAAAPGQDRWNLALFLASDESRTSTGQSNPVDIEG